MIWNPGTSWFLHLARCQSSTLNIRFTTILASRQYALRSLIWRSSWVQMLIDQVSTFHIHNCWLLNRLARRKIEIDLVTIWCSCVDMFFDCSILLVFEGGVHFTQYYHMQRLLKNNNTSNSYRLPPGGVTWSYNFNWFHKSFLNTPP